MPFAQIYLMEGRSEEQKRAVIEKVTQALVEAVGAPVENVRGETGEQFECRPDESVLAGLARTGKRGIPVGCRGGGCGVCKIHVVSGEYVRQKMSADHVDAIDLEHHCVLACRIAAASDLEIRVLGKMANSVQRLVGEVSNKSRFTGTSCGDSRKSEFSESRCYGKD